VNEVTHLLRSHRSIRKFTDRKVDRDIIEELVRCGQSAATSSNVQAVTVIQVSDQDKRDAIADLAGGQKYVSTAGAFLIYCADMNRSKYASEKLEGEFAAGMTEQFIIATVDVALAAQNSEVAAESLGLGICYIGGIRNNPAEVSRLLSLPEHVYPVFGLCLGYPDQNPEVKPRLPIDAVLMTDQYNPSVFDANIDRYDSQLQDYYNTRTGNNKTSNWSLEMKALVGKESRPHMHDFLTGKGFLQK